MMTTTNSMLGINSYGLELTDAEIADGRHREAVGGLWSELGRLQLSFLRAQGLRPHHHLLDLGCGALRGGLHLIEYLESGHYAGLDVNASLIRAGQREVELAGLSAKSPRLAVDDQCRVGLFGLRFEYAISISVFTHLPMDTIVRCMSNVAAVLAPGGHYYASYFEAPRAATLEPRHHPEGIVTHYDRDPFHQSFEELEWLAGRVGLEAVRLGNWGHPRGQVMCVMTRAGSR